MTQDLINAISNARRTAECIIPQTIVIGKAGYEWTDGGAFMDAVEGHLRWMHAEDLNVASLKARLPNGRIYTITSTGEVTS